MSYLAIFVLASAIVYRWSAARRTVRKPVSPRPIQRLDVTLPEPPPLVFFTDLTPRGEKK